MSEAGAKRPADKATNLLPGAPAPWFRAPVVDGNPRYAFDTVAGRHVLMLFFATAAAGPCKAALELVQARRAVFDDQKACFFGVSIDAKDIKEKRIAQSLPGIRFFADAGQQVSRLYGALPEGSQDYSPFWLLLDPMLRVVGKFPLEAGEQAITLVEKIAELPARPQVAPVLMVPRIFEPELCRHLIGLYQKGPHEESGFMREVDGKTVLQVDHAHKRRRDLLIEDPELQKQLMIRIHDRLVPLIARSFQFRATRMERYVVACYDAGTGGYFRPHRDNTTRGTAHRRFAVTINLNAEEYEGGDLRFPEFGPALYRAATGGAVVFSCSMLHEAVPVTKGTRYAFLPFLYDDVAARQREGNNQFLGEGLEPYVMEKK